MIKFILVILAAAYGIYQYTGGKLGTDKIFGPPEMLPLDRYEDFDVRVQFYYPADRNGETRYQYLGSTHGAKSCGNIARSYAAQHDLLYSDWSYVCCTHEAESDCYRKIR